MVTKATGKKVSNKRSEPIIIDVTFSPEIAAKLRAKKIRAFAPVSAAELIWLESLPTEE